MIRIKIFFIIILFFNITSFLSFATGKKLSKIVVDAGHGGKDLGAQGSFSKEKDITLAVSLKLGKMLTDSFQNLQVVYTRTDDSYPQLKERNEIANKANADLYISVHVNSTPFTYTKVLEGYKTVKKGKKTVKQPIYRKIRHHETKVNGVETYVMGLHRANEQKDAIGEFSDSVANGVLNEDDPQTAIIIAQYAQAFLKKSVLLGSKIQDQFVKEGRQDLGVKQKGLQVLAGSAMPGVLVEIGFITNVEEESYLNSENGQAEVAEAIYKGIIAYKNELEKQ